MKNKTGFVKSELNNGDAVILRMNRNLKKNCFENVMVHFVCGVSPYLSGYLVNFPFDPSAIKFKPIRLSEYDEDLTHKSNSDFDIVQIEPRKLEGLDETGSGKMKSKKLPIHLANLMTAEEIRRAKGEGVKILRIQETSDYVFSESQMKFRDPLFIVEVLYEV